MKEYKYYVMGGQYEDICYGGSDSLRGAKLIATKNREYWDNREGWHTPAVYLASGTIVDEYGKRHVRTYDTSAGIVPERPIATKGKSGWVKSVGGMWV